MAVFTPESLEIGLTLRVYSNPLLDYETLVLDMYNENSKNLPKAIEKRLYDLYIKHQKLIVQHQGKDFIANFVSNGDTKLIKHFLNVTTNGDERKMFENLDKVKDIHSRLENLEKIGEAKKVYKFFSRYFNNQMRVFVKTDLEDQFRAILREWIKSGEMNRKTWNDLKKWQKDGCSLSEFQKNSWKNASSTDTLIHKVKSMAKAITTDDFLEPALINKMLGEFLMRFMKNSFLNSHKNQTLKK